MPSYERLFDDTPAAHSIIIVTPNSFNYRLTMAPAYSDVCDQESEFQLAQHKRIRQQAARVRLSPTWSRSKKMAQYPHLPRNPGRARPKRPPTQEILIQTQIHLLLRSYSSPHSDLVGACVGRTRNELLPPVQPVTDHSDRGLRE